MYSRIINYPQNKSFFLFGPRGTGKTSWVRSAFPRAVYVDLLAAETFNDLLAHPGRLEQLVPQGFSDWIILDEVQKVPELLNEVHRLIETRRYKFVLTGSNARKLRRKGVNLLAGRALTLMMHPLTARELSNDFRLEHSLRFGQLPCAYTEADPKRYLESYVQTYLKEEVQQEGLTRNLAAFTRFLESASFSQGAILSIAGVARECAVERKVVEQYFVILEDLLLAERLPAFTKRAKRRMAAHPKFYFFDVGIYRTLRPMGPLDRPEEAEGAAYETLLYQELKAVNADEGLDYDLFYWRTATGLEVDFVAYGPKGIHAFEVKRTARVGSDALRGLKAFRADYPSARTYCIYGGDRRMEMEGIQVIPFEECLKTLPSLLAIHE
ncbi:MAG: ATP-binding protein [Deltaproteobacteria bacterium]|nr:ATP-binding protein [Deltaproteobacteria bacterium]